MSRLKRLLSDRPTSLERSLLEAAVKERPSEAQRMRVRRAMWEASPVSMNTAAGGTMATKGIVHRNTAGRYKSRLASRMSKATA